jgi:hypothetical protein
MKKRTPKPEHIPSPFQPELIALVNVQLTKFEISASDDFELDAVSGYNVEHSVELGFNVEDKLARVDFTLKVNSTSPDKGAGKASGNFLFVFIYQVENLAELTSIGEGNKLVINGALSSSITSISFSTSRGILLTKCSGTALQNFILPIINPSVLLNKVE